MSKNTVQKAQKAEPKNSTKGAVEVAKKASTKGAKEMATKNNTKGAEEMAKKVDVSKKSGSEKQENGKENMFKKGLAVKTKTVWMDSGKLINTPEIQRSLKTRRVNQIVGDFNPLLVNPIKVSHRGGKYYVFDGQHTLAALRQVYGTESTQVECKVFENLTFEQEAKLFAEQAGFSESVSMIDKLRALEAAKDEKVLKFLDVTRGTGFEIEIGSSHSRNGKIAAVVAAYTAYLSMKGGKYSKMLEIIRKTWAGESWSVTKNMIAGMKEFMDMYGGESGNEIDVPEFIHKLRRVTAADIRKKAETLKGMSIGSAFGAAIAGYYEASVAA